MGLDISFGKTNPSSPVEHVGLSASRALWRAVDYRVAALNAQYEDVSSYDLLEEMIDFDFAGSIALVSSFGTQSAVLLSLLAEVDPTVPVLFIDTGKLFPETLKYRDILTDQLGLEDVRTVRQAQPVLETDDPFGALWMKSADTCCNVRKVEPLSDALAAFDAWISGRKRFQGGMRTSLRLFEADGERIKINPLALWSAEEIADYVRRYDLPQHPLLDAGYRSVGCVPCTDKTPEGGDERAGRWAKQTKTECGIHLSHFR